MGEKNLLLLGPNGVHTISKLLGLVEVGQLALHPDQIGVRSVSDGAVNRTLAASADTVVALTGPGRVPVKVDVNTRQALGDGASFSIALALGQLVELLDHLGLVDVHAGVDSVGDSLVVELQVCLLVPRVFDGLQLGAVLAGGFGVQHQIVEGLQGGVGGAEDVGVVARVDCAGDEGCGFGVGTGDCEEVGAYESWLGSILVVWSSRRLTHDIGLSTNGNETVDVLANRHQDLASHVSALLGTRSLVLDVNTSRTLLNEQLRELHNSSQTTVSGVCVCNNRPQEIGVRC